MKKTLIPFLYTLSLVWLVPMFSSAAGITFSTENTTVPKNGTLIVHIAFDTGADAINAVEGTISYPADLIDAALIKDGNSSLNLWIEKPRKTGKGVISFSGVTPGGFSGSDKHLFSVEFQTKKEGTGVISAESIRALRNDGSGTPIQTTSSSLFFSIDNTRRDSTDTVQPEIEDNEPPESFTPVISRDPSLFGGKEFVAFSTTDKGSGVAKYDVKKGRLGLWRDATSPHRIERLFKRTRVSVRAIDHSGNIRVETIMPQTARNISAIHILFILLASAGAILYVTRKIRAR